MWRYEGVRFYQFILIFIILLQIGGILLFSGVLILIPFNRTLITLLIPALELAVFITAFVLFVLLTYQIFYYWYSYRQDQHHKEQYDFWLEKWSEIVFEEKPLTEHNLTPPAIQALLDMLYSLKGDSLSSLQEAIRVSGLRDRWLRQLKSRTEHRRLSALAALGVALLPETLPAVLEQLQHKHISVRAAAIRAAAAILDNTPPHSGEMFETFAKNIINVDLPDTVYSELYALLEDHPDTLVLINYCLTHETVSVPLLRATIQAVGGSRRVGLSQTIATFLNHPQAQIRAATLHAFAMMQFIPEKHFVDVLYCILDHNNIVRSHAIAAIEAIPIRHTRLPLWLAFNDSDWWVQLAAAEVLYQYGDQGKQMLETVSKRHENEKAREIAARILQTPASQRRNRPGEWIWSRQ